MPEKNTWETIKDHLHSRLTMDAYQNWVARTELLSTEGGLLRVAVPDEATKVWLEGEYAVKVTNAIRDLHLPVQKVQYELAAASGGNGLSVAQLIREGSRGDLGREGGLDFLSAPVQLNPRFRFENFVVGSCNQFAHAAAKAVATSPSRSYNPLFIYGGSGMGKSHLLHAIAHGLSEQYGGIRVLVTTAERFVNEMVLCIRNDRMSAFHDHYRTADALLIDDIHSIAGKERTQEEFFHTFNELYDHGKQIVLTSDQTPKNTPGLVERLRSRRVGADGGRSAARSRNKDGDSRQKGGSRRGGSSGRCPHLHRYQDQGECPRT